MRESNFIVIIPLVHTYLIIAWIWRPYNYLFLLSVDISAAVSAIFHVRNTPYHFMSFHIPEMWNYHQSITKTKPRTIMFINAKYFINYLRHGFLFSERPDTSLCSRQIFYTLYTSSTLLLFIHIIAPNHSSLLISLL